MGRKVIFYQKYYTRLYFIHSIISTMYSTFSISDSHHNTIYLIAFISASTLLIIAFDSGLILGVVTCVYAKESSCAKSR